MKVKSFSPVWLWATPWTAAYQAPPSMGFSRQEYWSGVPSLYLPLKLLLAITRMIKQRRGWHPTPGLLPGKSHGRRSLEGYSPWCLWGSDTTERLPFHFSLSCIGEGNGNPLLCSCLENPRDGAASWAAIYVVAQSQTWLKWLSSSSSSKCLMNILDGIKY